MSKVRDSYRTAERIEFGSERVIIVFHAEEAATAHGDRFHGWKSANRSLLMKRYRRLRNSNAASAIYIQRSIFFPFSSKTF